MIGSEAVANRSTKADRATTPGRATGGRNFDGNKSKLSLGVARSSGADTARRELTAPELTGKRY